MEQRDGKMKGGGRRVEGWVREREKSCQGNVYPCHGSQRRAMDKWITAFSDCQESSIRFDVFCRQGGSHTREGANCRISGAAIFASPSAFECAISIFVQFVYTGMFRLFSR